MPAPDPARGRWRASQRITLAVLALWAGVGFGGAFFARDLNGTVLGGPVSFWFAAQGALLVYLALVCVYARLMRRLDERHGLGEPE